MYVEQLEYINTHTYDERPFLCCYSEGGRDRQVAAAVLSFFLCKMNIYIVDIQNKEYTFPPCACWFTKIQRKKKEFFDTMMGPEVCWDSIMSHGGLFCCCCARYCLPAVSLYMSICSREMRVRERDKRDRRTKHHTSPFPSSQVSFFFFGSAPTSSCSWLNIFLLFHHHISDDHS